MCHLYSSRLPHLTLDSKCLRQMHNYLLLYFQYKQNFQSLQLLSLPSMDVATVSNALEVAAICKDDIVKRKDDIRKQVWDNMEQHDLVEDYPRPCHNKIPHFKVNTRLGCFNVKTNCFILRFPLWGSNCSALFWPRKEQKKKITMRQGSILFHQFLFPSTMILP